MQLRYTSVEAAQIIGVSTTLIFKWVKDERMIPLNAEDYRKGYGYIFSEEEVQRLKEEYEKQHAGLSSQEAAFQLGISQRKLILEAKAGKIPYREVVKKGKPSFRFEAQDIQTYKYTYLLKQIQEETLFSPSGYYLFQIFLHPLTKEKGRVMEIKSKGKFNHIVWVYLNNGERRNADELLRTGWQPQFPLNHGTRRYSHGAVTLRYPNPTNLNHPLFDHLNFLFARLNLINISLQRDPDYITIFTKRYESFEDWPQEQMNFLMEALKNGSGDIVQQSRGFILEADIESYSALISGDLRQQINQLLKNTGMNKQDLVEQALKTWVESNFANVIEHTEEESANAD